MDSPDPRFPRPPFLDTELERMGRATFSAGADLYRRWYGIGLRYAERAGDNAWAAWRDVPEPAEALHLWTAGARDFWTEMAAASAYSLQRFAGDLAPEAATMLPSSHRVDGKPVMLPARIHDASQAMAMWAVPAKAASAALAMRRGKAAPLFEVLDLGDGTTPFALFVVDYRESDLGSYHELGAAFFVRPASDPGALPGMFMVDLPVDDEFSCNAGQQIWGYPKTLEEITLVHGPQSLRCELRRGAKKRAASTRKSANTAEPVLAISFPRGGDGVSSDMPLATYTLRDGAPCVTTFTRNGSGETLRACSAGAIDLELGDAGDPLVDMLRALGLPAAAPMLRGWSEHMSGDFGIPRLLPTG